MCLTKYLRTVNFQIDGKDRFYTIELKNVCFIINLFVIQPKTRAKTEVGVYWSEKQGGLYGGNNTPLTNQNINNLSLRRMRKT